jgi:hypothetical protein
MDANARTTPLYTSSMGGGYLANDTADRQRGGCVIESRLETRGIKVLVWLQSPCVDMVEASDMKFVC